MVKKYHLSHQTIKHTIIEYADHAGEWAKLGAKISRTLFLGLSSLEEDMVEQTGMSQILLKLKVVKLCVSHFY
jgi:hypothetical protein